MGQKHAASCRGAPAGNDLVRQQAAAARLRNLQGAIRIAEEIVLSQKNSEAVDGGSGRASDADTFSSSSPPVATDTSCGCSVSSSSSSAAAASAPSVPADDMDMASGRGDARGMPNKTEQLLALLEELAL